MNNRRVFPTLPGADHMRHTHDPSRNLFCEGLPEHGGAGPGAGEGVPVIDGFGVDGTTTSELYIEALRAEEPKEVFAAGVETHLVERDGCDLCGLSAGEDGELATG